MHTGFWWRDLRAGDHLEDPCVDGRIILKWIFEKWDGGIDWIDLAQDRDRWAGCCECGNETLDFIKFGAFADWQRTSWLLRMDCAAWSMSECLLVQSRTSSKVPYVVARNLVERHCSTWQWGHSPICSVNMAFFQATSDLTRLFNILLKKMVEGWMVM